MPKSLTKSQEDIKYGSVNIMNTMMMRAERGVSSGGKRAAKMMPATAFVGSSEVDAVRNPTELFRRINSGDWEGALDTVNANPAEAAIWICRRKDHDGGLTWKYLPLHLICLQQRPPFELIAALLRSYPQAASISAPHDGNLPIHYTCESGCEDDRVFEALLAHFPKSLEVKNSNDKTPLLVCHPKSRGVLMKVLRQRKPLPFNEGKPQKRNKKKPRKSTERRQDIDASERSTASNEQRQPPKTAPARYTKHRCSGFADDASECSWEDSKTPRASNHAPGQKQAKKERSSAFFTTSPSSDDEDTDTGSLASKTTELARSAFNFLYPSSYQDESQRARDDALNELVLSLTKENAAQQRTIETLTKKLEQVSSSNEASIENSTLCERILEKAEADNVAFRTEIQKLQDAKQKMKREVEAKEEAHQKHLGQMRKLLCEKGGHMKLNASSEDILDCTRTMLGALEASLGKSDVALKKMEAKNATLQGERDELVENNRELEDRVTVLAEEKEVAQKGLGELKDRVTTLTVINENLQDQMGSIPNELDAGKREKESDESTRIAELEEKIKSLTEQNRSLKETILTKNEQYSEKVKELLEKANHNLRRNMNMTRASSGRGGRARSDLRVRLDEESKLLYEV